MVFVNVLTSAPLLPLVTVYQEGVNQDVCVLTRLGDGAPGGLGPFHTVMAPWLDRVSFRFLHQLCPALVFLYALEYGRVDLVRELMVTTVLRFNDSSWTLGVGTRRCLHRHLRLYTELRIWRVLDFNSRQPCRRSEFNIARCITGHLDNLAAMACRSGHVDLLRLIMNNGDVRPLELLADALRARHLCIVQDFLEQRVISTFTVHHVQLAVTSGSTHLVAFLLANSSGSMIAKAFDEAATLNQCALLHWLCTTYNDRTYWRAALSIAAGHLQLDVINYFATTHDLHLTPAEAARVQRRRKRIDDDGPTRQTRSRN